METRVTRSKKRKPEIEPSVVAVKTKGRASKPRKGAKAAPKQPEDDNIINLETCGESTTDNKECTSVQSEEIEGISEIASSTPEDFAGNKEVVENSEISDDKRILEAKEVVKIDKSADNSSIHDPRNLLSSNESVEIPQSSATQLQTPGTCNNRFSGNNDQESQSEQDITMEIADNKSRPEVFLEENNDLAIESEQVIPIESCVDLEEMKECTPENNQEMQYEQDVVMEPVERPELLEEADGSLIDVRNSDEICVEYSKGIKEVDPSNEAVDDDRTFLVLDEVGNSEEEIEPDDEDFDESEIDELLESNLNEAPTKRAKLTLEENEADDDADQPDYKAHKKTVLVEKRLAHFEVLPEGWIKIGHSSGMPVYLHRGLRVCTLSKPYYIGDGSARNHRVPLSSIPCLDYKRSLEEEKTTKCPVDENEINSTQARVLTTQENDEVYHLSPADLKEYCDKLFQFKDIQVMQFRTWPARRKFHRQKRAEQRASLPEGSKLITAPIKDAQSRRKSEWIMNPTGKTYVCIMHDYVQRALKKKPIYEFKEIDNTDTPYMVTISIDGVTYGVGLGSSKKLAKMEAAKATLDILIPGMKDKVEEDPKMVGRVGETKPRSELEFFDDIPIEDPRIVEYCTKTTEPLPHAILITCLQRNFGLTETNVTCSMNAKTQRKNVFTMTVGKHTVEIDCANKREGKQKASQALLQLLHPHVHSWGSILRLYGNASIKTFNEKKVEEQEITSLQNKSNSKGPNYAILNKLKEEMLKLKINRKAICPIGVFKPPDDVKMPTSSTSDLCNIPI